MLKCTKWTYVWYNVQRCKCFCADVNTCVCDWDALVVDPFISCKSSPFVCSSAYPVSLTSIYLRLNQLILPDHSPQIPLLQCVFVNAYHPDLLCPLYNAHMAPFALHWHAIYMYLLCTVYVIKSDLLHGCAWPSVNDLFILSATAFPTSHCIFSASFYLLITHHCTWVLCIELFTGSLWNLISSLSSQCAAFDLILFYIMWIGLILDWIFILFP